MSHLDYDGESFYLYAMELFSETGHVFTSIPEFSNHSPEEFVYLDNKSETSLSREQRLMFRAFNNVSRLFSVNGCVFFSINLLTTKDERSQAAHDIHTMLYPFVSSEGTICLFRYDEEVMLSFIGFGHRCILSDWYPMEDDYAHLSGLLDITNFSLDRGTDYFADMIHFLARSYYLYGQPSTYEILPIDFISGAGLEGIDREALDQYIEDQLTAPQRKYGDDYVEYDESVYTKKDNIGEELDFIFLDIDDEDDNPFSEEIELDDKALDEDDLLGKNTEETIKDEYEFNDVDPEIFRDPTRMVKWLKKNE